MKTVGGYPLHRLIGVSGGRSWHIRGEGFVRFAGGFYRRATLCGKPGNEDWRPGIRNRAGVCGACRRAEGRS